MPARKKTTRKSRPKKKAAKRTNRRRKASGSGKRKGGSRKGMRGQTWLWILLWPFLLLNRLTHKMRWWIKWPLRIAGHPSIVGAMGLALLCIVYGLRSQRYDMAAIHAMPERTIILDRHGRELGRMHGEKRSVVPLNHLPDHFKKAILAREDERFYYHPGFDPIGIARAVIMNLRGKREGASTITQQLSSDIYGLKEGEKRGQLLRQLDRKFLEIAIAARLEARYSKDEILEAYVNQINWGRQIRGIGEASRIYFEKHPAELNLSESAMLAGIVRGPDAYNPFRDMEAAERERNTTLDRMADAGKITQEKADAIKKKPLEVRPIERRGSNESYAMNAIRNELDIILETEDIDIGGLIITTTIDKRLQEKAVEALDNRLTEIEQLSGYPHPKRENYKPTPKGPEYIQGALVVIENRTGAVLTVVGGRDVKQSRFNRAKYARGKVGSIFKPFLYLAAFDRGMRPDTPVSDDRLRRGEIRYGENWNPTNSDGKYTGLHPAAYGLIRSRNTMSIRVANYAGMKMVQFLAKRAGFKNEIPDKSASSYLGSWSASPWEVASAYSIFPNEGNRFRPYIISEIRDRDGNVLYSTRPIDYLAAQPRSTRDVSRVLQQVTERGTGASVKRYGFTKPCGGKTGTTNNFEDAWFAGYTSQLSCAVWVGFDEPKRTISSGYGSYLALPVWAQVMKEADQLDYPAGILHNPREKAVDICLLSGKRATSGCAAEGCAKRVLWAEDTVPAPNDKCPLHPARAIAIDPETGLPIAPKAAPVIPENTPRAAPRAQPVNPVPEARPPRAVPIR